MAAATVTASDVEWTGEAVEPAISVVSFDGKTLVKNIDYTVSYRNALGQAVREVVDLGANTAVITGINGYTGTTSVEFNVTPGEMTGLSFADAAVDFDGKAHELAVSGELPEGAVVSYEYGEAAQAEPFSFVMPGEYKVTATVKAEGFKDWTATATLTVVEAASAGFEDVAEGEWYEVWANRAAAAGLMGYGADGELSSTFNPDGTLTRGEVATILYRAAGEDPSYTTDPSKFADDETGKAGNPDGMFYTAAVNWANEAGVMTGDEGDMKADAAITRAELGTMVARFADLVMGADVSSPSLEALQACKDVADVPEWAYLPLAWTAEAGVMGGFEEADGNYMRPFGTATRAEMAKVVVATMAAVAE